MNRLACFLVLCVACTAAGKEAHVLLVASQPDHPYATHMYHFECQVLKTCLEKNGVRATLVPKWPPTSEQLAGVSSIAFYSNPAGSVLLTEPHRGQFQELMKRDVGFVAIHWATGVGYDKISDSQANRDRFRSWLGGWFRRPPCGIKVGRSDLISLDPRHPISSGWDSWNIHDEFYLNPVLHKLAKPLLEVSVDGKRQVVGWTFSRSPGRSVGITLGHYHHNFAREDFRRLLINSILWSAHIDVPEQGAIVALESKDLELPSQEKISE